MSEDEQAKEAFKAKLRSLSFKPTGPKYTDSDTHVWVKPDDQKDVRNDPNFYGV